MKWLKWTGLALFFLPVLLIGIFILYEIFGMGVNHFATWRQTERLRADLEEKIPGVEIVSVYSETGNTSGTGNHVDCLCHHFFCRDGRRGNRKQAVFGLWI